MAPRRMTGSGLADAATNALPPSAGSGPSTGCIVIAQRLMLVGEVTEETLVEEEPHACNATSARLGSASAVPALQEPLNMQGKPEAGIAGADAMFRRLPNLGSA